MMFRRAFLWGLLISILASPLAAAVPQAGKVYRIGLVSITNEPSAFWWWQPFLEAMRELGYVERQNLTVKSAFAGGRPEDLPRLVNELVHSGVDVIVTTATLETKAAQRATPTIPIVMLMVPDPVGQGFVKTLARPGGNVTGPTRLVPGLIEKYVELLREAVPRALRFGVVAAPPNPGPGIRAELEAAAKTFGITLWIIPVSTTDDFDAVLARAKKEGVCAIIAPGDAVTFRHRERLVQAALKYGSPRHVLGPRVR